MGGDGGSRRNESVTRPLARPPGRGCGLRLVPDSAWSSLPSESVGRPGTAAAPVDALAAGLQVPWASLRWFGPAVARVALMRCRVGGPPRWLDPMESCSLARGGDCPLACLPPSWSALAPIPSHGSSTGGTWPGAMGVAPHAGGINRVMGVPPAGRGPARWEWPRMLVCPFQIMGVRPAGRGPAGWAQLHMLVVLSES